MKNGKILGEPPVSLYFWVMKNKPLVSTLIASHIRKIIKRCINSCLNQTYKNIEIILVTMVLRIKVIKSQNSLKT